MPFSDPILGGDFLVRPAMMSPNYVAGVSGWKIGKDGTVEFNNGVFRGSVQLGTSPGQHIILANPLTGDALDVYDASNTLVYNVTNTGAANSYQTTAPFNTAGMAGGNFSFTALDSFSFIYQGAFYGIPNFTTKDAIVRVQSFDSNSGDSYILELHSALNGGLPTAAGNERTVTGSLVQSDQLSTNNLCHVDQYSGVVAGGNGVWTFNHGCSFTPRRVVLSSWDQAGVQTRNYPELASTPLTATTCSTQWWDGVGNRVANGVTVAVHAAFYG